MVRRSTAAAALCLLVMLFATGSVPSASGSFGPAGSSPTPRPGSFGYTPGRALINGSLAGFVLDPFRPRLYLADDTTRSVVVIDTGTLKQVGSVRVGSGLGGMDISADGRQLYVTVGPNSTLAVVDLNTLKLSAAIKISFPPGDVAAGRLGRAYVTENDADEDWNYPAVVDTNASVQLERIHSAGPIASGTVARVSADRQTLYFADRDIEPSAVYRFSVKTDNVTFLGSSPFDTNPEFISDFAISPDESRIFMSSSYPHYVNVVDPTDWDSLGQLNPGSNPTDVALGAYGRVAFVAHQGGTSGVTLFDASAYGAIGSFPTLVSNGDPFFVRTDSAGSTVYVLDYSPAADVSQLEVFTVQFQLTAVLCASPVEVGTPDACSAFVLGSPTPTGTVVWSGHPGVVGPGSCTLSAGTCSVSFTPASARSEANVTAHYLGDRHNPASAGSFLVRVTKSPSVTSVSCVPSALTIGAAAEATCTALVSGYLPSTGMGSTVRWSEGGSGSVEFTGPNPQLCPRDALGQLLCGMTVIGSAPGNVTVAASYSGDGSNLGSSGSARVDVTAASATLVLSCGSPSIPVGGRVSCTATLTGYPGPPPAGSVLWSEVSGSGRVSISPGRCTLSSNWSCATTVRGTRAGGVLLEAVLTIQSNGTAVSGFADLTVT